MLADDNNESVGTSETVPRENSEKLASFVEHLRVSHFALLVASITLIAFCLSIPRRDIDALDQLNGIIDATEHWGKWDEIGASIYADNAENCKPWEYFATSISVRNQNGEPTHQGHPFRQLRIVVDHPCIVRGIFIKKKGIVQGSMSAPEKLGEFKTTWNRLREFKENTLPNVPWDEIPIRRSGNMDPGATLAMLRFRWSSRKPYDYDSKTQAGRTKTLKFSIAATDSESQNTPIIEIFKGLYTADTRDRSEDRYWLKSEDTADDQLEITIAGSKKLLIGMPIEIRRARSKFGSLQRTFAAKVGRDWREGPFSVSFPALYPAAKTHSLWKLDLQEVHKEISKIVAERSKALKIAGIEISGKQSLILGGLLVLITQTYFYFHLAKFAQVATTHGIPSQTPWIGSYTDTLPRWMSKVTGSVLPPLAIACSLYSVVLQTGFALLFSLTAGIAIFCLVASHQIWKSFDLLAEIQQLADQTTAT